MDMTLEELASIKKYEMESMALIFSSIVALANSAPTEQDYEHSELPDE